MLLTHARAAWRASPSPVESSQGAPAAAAAQCGGAQGAGGRRAAPRVCTAAPRNGRGCEAPAGCWRRRRLRRRRPPDCSWLAHRRRGGAAAAAAAVAAGTLVPTFWCAGITAQEPRVWPCRERDPGRSFGLPARRTQPPLFTTSNSALLQPSLSLSSIATCHAAETDVGPRAAFPLVVLFGANGHGAFEAAATLLLNWAEGWFEAYPAPPATLLRKFMVRRQARARTAVDSLNGHPQPGHIACPAPKRHAPRSPALVCPV